MRPFTAGWEFAPKLGGLGLGGILPKHARRIRWFFRLFFLVMLPSWRSVNTVDGRNLAPVEVGSLSRYLQCFMMFCMHPRWCRISSINRTSVNLLFQPKRVCPERFFFWMGLELQTTCFFHGWKWWFRPISQVKVWFIIQLKRPLTRWWLQICFISTPIWRRFPFWLIFFKWVETTNQLNKKSCLVNTTGNSLRNFKDLRPKYGIFTYIWLFL